MKSSVADIASVAISIEVDGRQALFILLSRDGSINRAGTGMVRNKEHDMFIGITKEPLFEQLMKYLSDEMLKYQGGYDIPEKLGVPCALTISFAYRGGEQNGFIFRYGSRSQGPPSEIGRFVKMAVQITDPWFKEQKKMTRQATIKGKRPWWPFWEGH